VRSTLSSRVEHTVSSFILASPVFEDRFSSKIEPCSNSRTTYYVYSLYLVVDIALQETELANPDNSVTGANIFSRVDVYQVAA